MLTRYIDAYEKFDELQELAKKAKQGRKGLQFGLSANVLDAGQIVKKCWECLESTTISACFIHSRCLPHLPDEIGFGEARDYRTQLQRRTITDICDIFSNFSIEPCNLNKLESLGLGELTEIIHKEGASSGAGLIERWLHLEADPEVVAAQEVECFNEVSDNFDRSISNEAEAEAEASSLMNVEPPPSPPNPVSVNSIANLSDETIKSMLLKYCVAAIEKNIEDPVLLGLAQGIRSHLTK
ncbi:Uncharacterized protein APZ42_003704 [Daphnia magna]|uniref:Uncharacterized protein n=2 Tax=Daphnia magna TaxID=35525 RepID=A0A168EK70_9CRUS|nr:Uncharacterized protein APZ42_003704 [Daphnia magna]